MQVAPSTTCYIFYSVFCWKDRPISFSGSNIGILVGKGNVGSYDVEIVCVNAVQTDNVFGLEINP